MPRTIGSVGSFVVAVASSVGLLWLESRGLHVHTMAVSAGCAVLVAASFRATSPVVETTLLPCVWAVAAVWVEPGGIAWLAPLVGWTLALLAHRVGGRLATGVAILATVPWIVVPDGHGLDAFRIASLVCTALSLVGFAWHGLRRSVAVRDVDVVVCSYSANTAHFVEQFRRGVENAAAAVTVHRHHHTPGNQLQLRGDALVIAYPVIGWNPPYPVFELMIHDLPRGRGKPAYVLHSSAGGPENAFFLAWLLLLLKGYRPSGRLGGTYPVNVTTFRIGPQRMWSWFDKLLPRPSDVRLAEESGAAFARGQSAGLPFWLWPSPLFIANFPLVFKYLNHHFYRPYLWKWRCNKCNACLRACPTGRLRTGPDGFPTAKGRCVLCYDCVNLCPTNAMQAIALTEYGARYRPRFNKLVVRNRPRNARSGDQACSP